MTSREIAGNGAIALIIVAVLGGLATTVFNGFEDHTLITRHSSTLTALSQQEAQLSTTLKDLAYQETQLKDIELQAATYQVASHKSTAALLSHIEAVDKELETLLSTANIQQTAGRAVLNEFRIDVQNLGRQLAAICTAVHCSAPSGTS